jgi:hypothetical protein
MYHRDVRQRSMKIAVVTRAALTAAALALGACGSSSDKAPPGPGPSASPGAVIQGSAVVPAHAFAPVSLTTTAGGTLTIRLDLSRNIVVAGIFPAACAAGTRVACSPLAYTESASSDSSDTLTATGASPGTYVVIFGNLGGSSQSVAYSASLTTS